MKIQNPVVLINIHDNYENSLSVSITDGSDNIYDTIIGCQANLDEVPPDDRMDHLQLEVLYYVAMELEAERAKNKKLLSQISNYQLNA
ncbi:TPA: hypothetical protein ACS781_003854 [Providencia alcalifaciens]